MAGKPKNRLELRRQHEATEDLDPMEDESEVVLEDTADDEVERKPRKKRAPAKPKKATKTAKPAARMRIVWVVVNDAFKPVATFDYSQKAAAETKAEEMNAKGKGTFFVQRVKEPMPDDAPGLGASIPRATPASIPSPVVKDGEFVSDDDEEEITDDEDDTADDDADIDEEEEED